MRKNEHARSGSDAAESCITTAGERFPDGAMIELIARSPQPDLLLWNGQGAKIGPRVEYGGLIYTAADLHPTLRRAIRLPEGLHDYGSARALFDSVRELFERYLGLHERESSLLACFSISTWMAGPLRTAPNLTISGPDEDMGIDALRLLSSVCRHSLILAELTPSSFRLLPMYLSPTLLLDQQGLKPNVQRLLRASSHRGLYLPGNRGGVIDLYGPKAIFSGNDTAFDSLGGGIMQISLPPSPSVSLTVDVRVQNEIANYFQPRLLMYRLSNCGKVGDAPVDVSAFTFTTRPLARTLAECFPGDHDLSRDAVRLLQPQDDEVRGQRLRDVNCAIAEILLCMIHTGRREVLVGELAQDTNALLRSRGEILEVSAESVGWKLRDLHIRRHDSASGQLVRFGRETSHTVHQLTQAYDLPCSQHVEAGCPECNSAKTAVPK